jgi:phosphoribosylformimino-5-aminoimidazole carboxamide ribotide isomerase
MPLDEWFACSIEVIPAVDVVGDEAVRLRQGDYAHVVERADDPAALARRFAAAGARWIHLVDLDGARAGRVRPELVRRVVAAAAPAAVQASGGIRSLDDAHALLSAGAAAVVVGTAATSDPAPWIDALGNRVLLALDVRDGRVRTAGWTADGGLALEEAVERYIETGVRRVLCTAIDRDGMLVGPDRELVTRVASAGFRVTAAGGIRRPGDVEAVASAGAEAAVVGRALLQQKGC